MNGWAATTLADIVAPVGGLRRGPFGGAIKKEIFVDAGYKIYEQQHAIYGNFDVGRYFIDAAKFRELKNFAVEPNDLIVSCSGTMGRVAIVPKSAAPGIINQALLRVRPDPEKVYSVFLKRLLETPEYQSRLFEAASGSAIKNVQPIETIRTAKIMLPPIEEQKRIAAILDQADDLRRKRQRALDRLNQLGQAIFYEMFGDPISPNADKTERLAEIAELINGDRSSNYPSGDDIKDRGVLFLNTTNIQNGELNLAKSQFITPQKFASLSRGKLERGDLVITLRGTLGQCALFDCEHKTGFINAQMMIIRCREKVLPRYLKEFISFPSVQDKLNRSNSGSAVPQLTATQMKEMQIIVPSTGEQLEFVSAVDAARKVLGVQHAYANDLGRLFASLQHRAFRGEL